MFFDVTIDIMAVSVGVLCGAAIKIDFVSDFLYTELFNDESKNLVSMS